MLFPESGVSAAKARVAQDAPSHGASHTHCVAAQTPFREQSKSVEHGATREAKSASARRESLGVGDIRRGRRGSLRDSDAAALRCP